MGTVVLEFSASAESPTQWASARPGVEVLTFTATHGNGPVELLYCSAGVESTAIRTETVYLAKVHM